MAAVSGVAGPCGAGDEDLAIALLKISRSPFIRPLLRFHAAGHIVVSLIVPKREFAEGIGRVLAFFD